MISSILSPLNTPPQRPNKSRLRTVSNIDQLSSHSSINSTFDKLSQDGKISIASNQTILSPPERSRFRSNRLRENNSDELLDEIINEFILPPTSGQSRTFIHNNSLEASKKVITVSRSTEDLLHVSPDRVKLSPSTSIPHQLPPKKPSNAPRKYANHGSTLTTVSGHTKHHRSLNCSDIIIARLEGWQLFLKSIVGWLEETSKINLASSRGYSQRAYSFLDASSGIATTNKGCVASEKTNRFVLTVQAGLHAITMQLAVEQQALSQTIEKTHIPNLVKLQKEVKDKIQKLKNDSSLVLDDLLRRAQVTKSKMMILNKSCKQVNETTGQVEMDPWLANSLVLYFLKREVEEENRLRSLLIPIQKDAHEFEQRVIEAVRPAIEHCYKKLGSQESVPFQHHMDQLSPLGDWEEFVRLNQRDLVDENVPKKDYLKINYPNKSHTSVNTLLKGSLQRKSGTRKQFLEKHYVLSQGGYLHEFASENQLTPERTFYIPSSRIIPSIDINHLSKALDDRDTELTFEIYRPSTSILHKDKVAIFKASTKDDLLEWCHLLIQVSTGIPIKVPISRSNRKSSLNRDKVTVHEEPKDASPILEDNESGVIDDYFNH